MTEKQSSRFKDALWFPKEETNVIVGGAGGIGSWLTILLARAGFFPIVYDFDVIEEHNMGGQLYGKKHITKSKVGALKDIVQEFTETEIVAMDEAYTLESMSHTYVFSAFDNMKARKEMFEAWCAFVEDWKTSEDTSEIPVFIDGRLTMEQLQIFCVTPDRIDAYKEHLFDDTEVPDAPCTLKQTSHSAAMIASHMVGFFTNHITNNNVGDTDRNLPFMWEYFIPVNYVNEITV